MNKGLGLSSWQRFWLLLGLLWVCEQLLQPTFATPIVRFVFSILCVVLTIVVLLFVVLLVVAVVALIFRPAAFEQFVVPRWEMLRRVLAAVRRNPTAQTAED